MAERAELVRVVAEALLGHQNISLGTPDTMRCGGCGLRTNGGANSPDHVHHQAAAVVDALGEHLALPVVAHKGPHDTDASMFAQAACRLEAGFPVGGSNLRDAVVRLIRREVARAATTESEG